MLSRAAQVAVLGMMLLSDTGFWYESLKLTLLWRVVLQGSALTCPHPKPCTAPRCAHEQLLPTATQEHQQQNRVLQHQHGLACRVVFDSRTNCWGPVHYGKLPAAVYGAVHCCYASSFLLNMYLLQSPGSGQLSSSPFSPSLDAYKTKHAEREVQW
jgi:hypothetical protein